ncbi:MAG: hypothetical protein QNJ63_05210 [Calothrix sp. MO_192.B10]|nr:hypothetical protein [Calothrix sp. MO_192.B10]
MRGHIISIPRTFVRGDVDILGKIATSLWREPVKLACKNINIANKKILYARQETD